MQNASCTHGYYKSTILPIDISHDTVHTARESSDTYVPRLVCPQEYYRLHETAVVQTDKVMALPYIHSCHR